MAGIVSAKVKGLKFRSRERDVRRGVGMIPCRGNSCQDDIIQDIKGEITEDKRVISVVEDR